GSPGKVSSPSLVTSSIEDVILSMGKSEDDGKEDSMHSTSSSVRLAAVESYRRERNNDSTRRRSRSRLDELRQSRRDQESQLRNMVKKQHASTPVNEDDEKAVDSTDVMKVIVNLRDELAAAQQVIEQQRVLMEIMSEQAPSPSEPKESSEKGASSLGGWFLSAPKEEEPKELEVPLPPDTVSKKQYEELQSRFSKLQMDRAWAEFKLRDRVTTDALKFHRRLRHWKDQSIELRCTIQNMENDHALALVAAQGREDEKIAELKKEHDEKLKELQEEAKEKKDDMEDEYEQKLEGFKMEAERFQRQAEQAKEDLSDYKKSTEVAFDEFCDAKDRIDELEFEIAKLKGGEDFDEDRPPRRKYRQRLTRRESKKSLSDDDDDDASAEGAGLTSYLSSWYYGAPSDPARDSAGEEASSNSIDLSSRSHRSNTPLEASDAKPPTEDDKASWGAWGLTTYFHKEESPDHEMNLTD
ncbi:MAG: hypothetical protein SGILL_009084, partial [Bacillariaceae sp.]